MKHAIGRDKEAANCQNKTRGMGVGLGEGQCREYAKILRTVNELTHCILPEFLW